MGFVTASQKIDVTDIMDWAALLDITRLAYEGCRAGSRQTCPRYRHAADNGFSRNGFKERLKQPPRSTAAADLYENRGFGSRSGRTQWPCTPDTERGTWAALEPSPVLPSRQAPWPARCCACGARSSESRSSGSARTDPAIHAAENAA